MTIKCIFHGGETKINCERNGEFFRELVSSAKDGKILDVIYAKPENEWARQVKIDLARFKKEVPDISFNLEFADRDSEIFLKQVETADVIYFKGDSNQLLKNYLMPIKDELTKLFKNKVIAGCSAGVNVMAKYYFCTDRMRIEEGLNFLSVKGYCHYKNDKKNLAELKKHKENLKTYAIREADFVVVNQENIS